MIKDIPFEWPERDFILGNLYSSNKQENVLDEIKNETKEISQKGSIKQIIDFIKSEDKNIFILTWWAWTWKTTIIKEIYNFLIKNQKSFQITTPTWKATYNLSSRIENINSDKISTIFSELYEKYNSVDIKLKDVIFFETKTLDKDVYIVDEAWLIWLKTHKDENIYQQNVLNFWSWSLLKDIIENLWNKTKIIFVWDLHQLLPIWDNKIFSLDNNFYQSLNDDDNKKIYLAQNKFDENFNIKTNSNFKIDSLNLTKNYRQENWNWIAINAETIKKWIINKEYSNLIEENNETFVIKNKTLFIEKLKENYHNNEENIIISYTNNSILEYNKIIRDDILFYKNIIEIWEKLIISKNLIINDELFFNWEIVEVVSINDDIETYKNIFVWKWDFEKIDLTFLDIDIKKITWNKEKIYNLKLCLNTLNSNENWSWEDINIWKFISSFVESKIIKEWWNIKTINKKRFFYKTNEAKEDLNILESENQEYLKIKKQDKYYNSLHANYWYAITCHKSQWSEWNNIFLDLDSYSQWKTNENFLRFLYTWITRAKNKVYILNNDDTLINETKKHEDIASNFEIEKLFIKNYINKIQDVLKKYNYFIVWIQEFNYQIQITFTNWQSDWKIWFFYNGKNKFTTKQSINDTWFNQTIIQILIDNKL
jgi:hypothetical protein